LNALWALKHYIHSAGNDVKKSCVDELGQGWLVQLICDDTEDEALSAARSKPSAFNAHGDIEEDVAMDQLEDDYDARMTDSIGALGHSYTFDVLQTHSYSRGRGAVSLQASARLAALRDLETNPVRRARKDDIAVQEQGLDFVRNLIGCNHVDASDSSDMIDFLMDALGQDQIFEILASKLRPKVINPFNKRSSVGNGETRVIPPQAEIIASVEYILVHMAASIPRHRQLLITQTELLKLLLPQFSHINKEVRLALCWLVNNLTCLDDGHDGQARTARIQELKKLGFLSKLEILERDCDLDVQERAKTAVDQIKQGC
jgi:armadillo repeat-containing protein 8